MRQYSEIAPQDYTDGQKNDFLQATVAGTPQYCGVLQSNTTAARAAGVRTEFTFEEYFTMLLEHAAVKDASNNLESNPRNRKNLNAHMMEIVFEDGQVSYEAVELEVNSHQTVDNSINWDMDTPIAYIEAHQNETTGATAFSRPQRVWMDDSTWSKMPQPDRRAWLSISEASKKNILNHGSERKENPAFRKDNPGGSKPGGYKPNARRANTHEIDESEQEEPPHVLLLRRVTGKGLRFI